MPFLYVLKTKKMKNKTILLVTISCLIITGCGVDQSEFDKVKKDRDEFEASLKQMEITIQQLHDTISMLSYPANQRITKINNLVSAGNYSEAKQEMEQLAALFPESKEAQSIPSISEKIDNLIAKQKAEEERIKALGFKALKTTTSVTIEENKVSFSNISTSKTFSFDAYGDRWFYRTADRGNVYFTASMQVTSSSKDPNLPTLAVYSIKGDKMEREGIMEIKFARWEDYGSYLGNYHDNGNDFAKTSTINFKLGVELSSTIKDGPYAIILKKSNELTKYYARFDNPPISYIGSVAYPYSLYLDDFTRENSKFVIIKIANL